MIKLRTTLWIKAALEYVAVSGDEFCNEKKEFYVLAEAPLCFGSERRTVDVTWCLVVREESDYFYGP